MRWFRARVQVGAAAAAALATLLVVGFWSHHPSPASLAAAPAAAPAVTAGQHGLPVTQQGSVARGAGAAEKEIDTIGRDALKLWGAWDGLSPVATQMMAQTPPRATPATPQAAAATVGREEGLRGRISARVERGGRDAKSDKRSGAQSLHMTEETQDTSLDHEEREAAPFPYVHAVFSLHGLQKPLKGEMLTEFKESMADAVGLSAYGNGEMRAVLGQRAYEWIVVQSQGPVNCTATPHICDDKGRRRRRLLSVCCLSDCAVCVYDEEPRRRRARYLSHMNARVHTPPSGGGRRASKKCARALSLFLSLSHTPQVEDEEPRRRRSVRQPARGKRRGLWERQADDQEQQSK